MALNQKATFELLFVSEPLTHSGPNVSKHDSGERDTSPKQGTGERHEHRYVSHDANRIRTTRAVLHSHVEETSHNGQIGGVWFGDCRGDTSSQTQAGSLCWGLLVADEPEFVSPIAMRYPAVGVAYSRARST